MFIIIHGPLEEDFLIHNLKAIQQDAATSHIIISVYSSDLAKAETIVNKIPNNKKIKIVGSEDVFNPGFYNINRQINLVKAGLSLIEDENEIVLKVRMDQTINFRWMSKFLINCAKEIEDKLITTNCYTRKDRLFHPSDMFLAGTKKTLSEYYPKDFFPETHMDCLLRIKELVLSDYDKGFHHFWPESRLFINFLNSRGEQLVDSEECSKYQLEKHAYVINSWDLGLKWKKFLKGKISVLPYFFTLRPFEGGPLENAENYLASELVGYKKKKYKECIYNNISKVYFKSGAYLANPLFINYKAVISKSLRRAFDSSYKYTPPILHNLMYKVAKRVYHAFK